jgi:hypothetical protein
MIAIGSDVMVSLDALTSNTTGLVINNASEVTGRLLNGSTLIYSFDLTSAGSGGNYIGTIPAATTAALLPQVYTIRITAVTSVGTLVLAQDDVAAVEQG